MATPEKGKKLFDNAVNNLVEFGVYFRKLQLRPRQDMRARKDVGDIEPW
jgi:hypothetical protein